MPDRLLRRLCLCLCLCLALATGPAHSEEAGAPWRHGATLFGELKYPPGFSHFDYVNPDAPKGGLLRLAGVGGFDSLNPFLIKGRPAAQLGLIYDTLMTPSFDEPASEYGLIARAVSWPPDHSSVTFTLRAGARFHDGHPITAEDAVWSLQALKKAHPFYRAYYADIVRGEALSPHKVRFVFAVRNNRELPHIAGQLPVLPKHYWQAQEEDGGPRDFFAAGLNPPLGSGPYRIESVKPGRSLTYARAGDYWARDLPVNRGRHNFGRIRIDYFGDDDIALEAFKAGTLDFRAESSSKNWATAYERLADDPRLVRRRVPDANPSGMQGFVFNTRRPHLADRRVRAALAEVFDFEWMNRTLFYGQYERTRSYFEGSELAAHGAPAPEERALLRRIQDQAGARLPAEIFERAFAPPPGGGAGPARAAARRARALLRQAGWTIRSGVLTHAAGGQPMKIEFLLVQPRFQRVVLPYIRALERLGVQTSLRIVDPAQYRSRLRDYDFDIVISTFRQSHSPGNEQRDFWGSDSADQPGGRNLAGIKNRAVDLLIKRIIAAPGRAELITATRALDRVLLWNHYVVPHWHIAHHRLAWWKPLAAPDPLPAYNPGLPDIWWRETPP